MMTFNYFKIAFRNLRKNKVFSAINISGLSIGIASFVMIMMYVSYEKSYDTFFDNSENIYRVYMDYLEGETYSPGDAETYNLSGPTLKKEFPEIKEFVRLYPLDKSSFRINDETFEVKNGHLADPSYFTVFSYPLLRGNISTALNAPNSIVITETIANKIFGKNDPMGKVINVFHSQKKAMLTVSGVMKDIPQNTHMKTNFLVSFQTNQNWEICRSDLNWNNNNFFTYLLVDAKTDKALLKEKIMSFEDHVEDERHNIEALTSIHLYSHKPFEAEANGYANRVFFLLAISIIIIVLSWLNYINLSTSQSLERAKETGIRKVSGANRIQLIFQFLSESILINVVAFLFAVGLILILLPTFQAFTGIQFKFDKSNTKFLFMLVAIVLSGALVSGLYPAWLLSKFQPVKILRGKFSASPQTVNLRKSLVIVQFLATIILLMGTITINKQIRFIQSQSMGVNTNHIISIEGDIFDEQNNHENQFQTLKDELLKLPHVKSTATADTYPGKGYYDISSFMGLRSPKGTEDYQTVWYNYGIDHDFIPMMELELLAGTNFTSANQSRNQIILNETAAKKMGIEDYDEAIHASPHFWDSDWDVIGIVKDYHHFGLNDKIEPIILRFKSISDQCLLVQLHDNVSSINEMSSIINGFKKEWTEVFPQSTFNYGFVDEEFESQYNEDKKFNKAFSIFTILAIFIASMGLFGLAQYTCTRRTKEVGIRKVNGAKISEVLTLLNKDFITWVAIAFVLACPIAYYAMNLWLENFAYKTTLSWWIFALAGVLALGIALLTVSGQSWRAATRNPVEALRYE